MGSPESEDSSAALWDGPHGPVSPDDRQAAPCAEGTLREIAERLQSDPQECWQAVEALAAVELDVRLSIIDELSRHPLTPGARTMLRLLSTARDRATRTSARSALSRADAEAGGRLGPDPLEASNQTGASCWIVRASGDRSGFPGLAHERLKSRVERCLVAPVDGLGRGSIVISVNHGAQRRTAAFLCDVQQGICDVVGEVECESPSAGGLLDDLDQQADADGARDVPELAIGLLAGSLMLCQRVVPPAVRDWIDGTLGREFQAEAFPAIIPGLDPSSIPGVEMPARVHAVFESCPSWLDASPLTFELAEEISLRECRPAALPDPDRDAGLYRFLFEHRIIHKLEVYRRMLWWMAWVWNCSARPELSRSALALASQLSDEQYAVPSHPFAVELTTRSLKAAQQLLHTPLDPRPHRRTAREASPSS
jgi:hypothetical protein